MSIRLPGSGGYGPPEERDIEKIHWDVINGKVGPESAREDYKVVFKEDLTVDEGPTRDLRSRKKERV